MGRLIQIVLVGVVIGGLSLAASVAEPPRSEFAPRFTAENAPR